MYRNSLTARLALLLALCIGATLALTTAVEYQLSRTEILAEVEADTSGRVLAVVDDLESRLSGIAESAELFAEVLEHRVYSEAELTSLLREAVDEREDIYGAAIALAPAFTSTGTGFAIYYHYRDDGSLNFNDLSSRDYDYPNRAWYRDVAGHGQPRWSEPYFDEGGGEVLMSTYSVPMFRSVEGQRRFYGVVTADISLQRLQDYIDRIRIGDSGFGFLLSRGGRLMAARGPGNLMRPLLQVLPATEDLALWGRWMEAANRGESVRERLPCYHQRGECILKLVPLSTTRWPVGAYYSEHEVLAPLRDYLRSVVLSGLLTLALLMVVVWWASRRITRPLRQLAAASADIATGNFHTTLPAVSSSDELGRLVKAFSLMQDNLQHYVDELQAETGRRHRLEGELTAAAEIQRAMLPQGGQALVEDPRFLLWARLRPARSVGGDLYGYAIQPGGRLLLAVGDVSDKGTAAALFMARAMTLLQQYHDSEAEPAAILGELNEALTAGNEACMFVTLFLGCIDLDCGELTFASAGHTAPRLIRNGRCEALQQAAGPALGLAGDLVFPDNRVRLQRGDRLAVFTDGIDEAFSETGEQFGLERLETSLADTADCSPTESGEALFSALADHAGSAEQSDDMALLLVDLPGASASFAVGRERLVSAVQQWLGDVAGARPTDYPPLCDLQLVAEEVVSNIAKYAALPKDAMITLQLGSSSRGPWLQVSDPGRPFNPLRDARRSEPGAAGDAAEPGGHGVHLLEAMTAWQSYQREGGCNVLRLGWGRRVDEKP